MTAIQKHGGNLRWASEESGIPQGELLDFSASINPRGFPDWLRPLISSQISNLAHYPDPNAAGLIEAIARFHHIDAVEVVVGNGASELLYLLPRVLNCRRLLVPVPSYSDYAVLAQSAGMAIDRLSLLAEDDFQLNVDQLACRITAEHLIVLGHPNNPTGKLCDIAALKKVVNDYPNNYFIVDESFIDFASPDFSLRSQRPENLIIVQSMTKAWAIPGLRLGYALADAKIVAALNSLRADWTVNTLAQAVGIRALQDDQFLLQSRDYVAERRRELFEILNSITGLSPFPSDANFLLVANNHPHVSVSQIYDSLLKKGIIIRRCGSFDGLDESYFRVAVRSGEEQQRLCHELRNILAPKVVTKSKRKIPAIMFQGTGSNAGKSIMTAALCRILYQDGVSVAPFKAQNMSLNSGITFQGGEMGRAQLLQAQASRLDADVRMNPVLLKPSSATGSQVIVCGKVLETMDFCDYAKRRGKIFTQVQQCYDSLANEHQVMILEGAGSPAEINLKSRDIVNMNMARYADAHVLLVGDIDRGGVFASFVGTLELLNECERKLVDGFVINRFRGDKSLLGDALDLTTFHTGKPFYGVVPFLPELGLPEEDSVDFKDGLLDSGVNRDEALDIALIDLPHISNFTDFDALRIEDDVVLRRVCCLDELGTPDAIILPGTKNVISDLDYLAASGLAAEICRLANGCLVSGTMTEIIGICGGYQFMGELINDPHKIESSGKCCRGLGLLPMKTTLQPSKTTTRCRAAHLSSGETVSGYEIHHGTSLGEGLQAMIKREDGVVIGHCADGREHLWGTYLHGIFDADGFRRWFLDRLRLRKGWSPLETRNCCYDLEPALDRLADHVRAFLDMDRIYRILEL
ncbi:MAG: threonine-phosphate decarboxylase [Desulfobacteraceae bacterium 4572_35.1]|nr:MAG: threonine-phosphate decarboxylase [Desulfobacteraceae bacterium 4572_35.1]